jgi:hypothetical protein
MSSIRALSGFNAETVTYRPLTVAQIDRLQPFARPREGRSLVSGRCCDAVVSRAIGACGN